MEKKEKIDEEDLKAAKLTQKRAIEIHDEAASIIRALLDLKDLLKRREHGIEKEDDAEDLIRRKVNEAKRWNKFMDQIKKDES